MCLLHPPTREGKGGDLTSRLWAGSDCGAIAASSLEHLGTSLFWHSEVKRSWGCTSPVPGTSAPLPRHLLIGAFGNLGQAMSPILWGPLVFHPSCCHIYELVNKTVCYPLLFSVHCGETLLRMILQFVLYLFPFFFLIVAMNFHNHLKFALIEVFSD